MFWIGEVISVAVIGIMSYRFSKTWTRNYLNKINPDPIELPYEVRRTMLIGLEDYDNWNLFDDCLIKKYDKAIRLCSHIVTLDTVSFEQISKLSVYQGYPETNFYMYSKERQILMDVTGGQVGRNWASSVLDW